MRTSHTLRHHLTEEDEYSIDREGHTFEVNIAFISDQISVDTNYVRAGFADNNLMGSRLLTVLLVRYKQRSQQ